MFRSVSGLYVTSINEVVLQLVDFQTGKKIIKATHELKLFRRQPFSKMLSGDQYDGRFQLTSL